MPSRNHGLFKDRALVGLSGSPCSQYRPHLERQAKRESLPNSGSLTNQKLCLKPSGKAAGSRFSGKTSSYSAAHLPKHYIVTAPSVHAIP